MAISTGKLLLLPPPPWWFSLTPTKLHNSGTEQTLVLEHSVFGCVTVRPWMRLSMCNCASWKPYEQAVKGISPKFGHRSIWVNCSGHSIDSVSR